MSTESIVGPAGKPEVVSLPEVLIEVEGEYVCPFLKMGIQTGLVKTRTSWSSA